MVFMPIGYARQPGLVFKKLVEHARIVANRCGINTTEKDPEKYIIEVLDKLSRDHEALLLEVEKLEEQSLDFRPPAQTVSTTEAARILNCTSESVRNWIRRGFLNAVQEETSRNTGHVFKVYIDDAFQAIKNR